VDLQDKDEYNLRKTLDAGQVKQASYFKANPITLSWVRIPNGVISGFSTMITTLYSYKDTVKYINYGTADYRAVTTPTWNKVLVIDVETTTEPGGKLLRNITLTITPEP
jgi:hypothetical protein